MQDWSIAGTRNTKNFLQLGVDILKSGGSALDAVETVIKEVELDPSDWTVGFNGFPNLLGEIELDASIMVGSSKRTGAVAGVKGYLHPISIARSVMELSPHVLLVGEGAERFARAAGFQRVQLLAQPFMRDIYQKFLTNGNFLEVTGLPIEMRDSARHFDDIVKEKLAQFDYRAWYERILPAYHGTVDVIALDQIDELCSGISTSGLALKFPGRVGDSPIIGAGNFADSRYGAATCVGNGELAIRLSMASNAVFNLKRNTDPKNAASEAVKDLLELDEVGVIQILVMNAKGEVAAACNMEGHYYFSSSLNPVVQKMETIVIELDKTQH